MDSVGGVGVGCVATSPRVNVAGTFHESFMNFVRQASVRPNAVSASRVWFHGKHTLKENESSFLKLPVKRPAYEAWVNT